MLVWFRITLATFLAKITAMSLCLSKLCLKYYWFLFPGHGVVSGPSVRLSVCLFVCDFDVPWAYVLSTFALVRK